MSKIKKRLMAAVVKLVIMILLFNFPLIGSTNSYFSDQEASAGNRISAGDWTAPLVKIETPGDGTTVSGSVGIYGTITDNAPHHYWLVVENSEGSVVAGPGVVSETNSLTNQLLYTWNTTLVSDGSYTIKLEARDAANNKDLDESVDWITVSVDNVLDEPSPTPTPIPLEDAGVVINEVMWMGSHGSPADEWVEFRNTTDEQIDLTGWVLKNAGENPNPDITLSGTIPAHGFFLLSNYVPSGSDMNDGIVSDQVTTGVSLNNSGEELILQDNLGNTVDQTPAGSWPAGNNTEGLRQSMERNDDPASGWQTCTDVACNDTVYWDSEGDNYGTPKSANLSGEPRLDLYTYNEGKTVGFRVLNTGDFRNLSYELTYDTDTISDGVVGSEDLSGQEEYTKEGITLGTCSSGGGTCVYYTGVYNIKLKVILEDSDGNPTALEKII